MSLSPSPSHPYNKQGYWRPSRGGRIPVCGLLQVGRPIHPRGLAQDDARRTVHAPGILPGTQTPASAFPSPAVTFTMFSSASFFAAQSLQAWFRWKNGSFGARKSWVESQLLHPHWALGLSTSYFSSLSLKFSKVKATQCRVSEITSIKGLAHSRCSADACVPTHDCWPWLLSVQNVPAQLGSLTSPHVLPFGTAFYTWIRKSMWGTASGNVTVEQCPTVALETEISSLKNGVRLERTVWEWRGQRLLDARTLRSRFPLIRQT